MPKSSSGNEMPFWRAFCVKLAFFACKERNGIFAKKKINHSSCFLEGKHFRLTALNDGMTLVAPASISLFEIRNEL